MHTLFHVLIHKINVKSLQCTLYHLYRDILNSLFYFTKKVEWVYKAFGINDLKECYDSFNSLDTIFMSHDWHT